MDICEEKCVHFDQVNETLANLPTKRSIEEMAAIFKALSDPSRLKIVTALLISEHCVCDLAVICGQSDSAVSHQLRILRGLRVVKNRRDGKNMYYSLDDDHVVSLIEMGCAHTREQGIS